MTEIEITAKNGNQEITRKFYYEPTTDYNLVLADMADTVAKIENEIF